SALNGGWRRALVLESNLNWIFDIEFVDRRMQFAALLDDCRKIFVQPGNDFVNLYVGNHRSQPPHQSFDLFGPTAQGKIADCSQSDVHSVQRITDGIRELGLQQQEIRYPFRFEFGGACLAISFKRSATA